MSSNSGFSFVTTFIVSGAAIPAGSRVKYVGNRRVALAGVGDTEIGQALVDTGKDSYAIGDAVGIIMKYPTRYCLAGGAFADGDTLKRAANGKLVNDGSGADYALALAAATADGDLVEVLPLDGGLVAAVPADIVASTDITAVPGAFADLAAVQTYLDTAVPIVEDRLDALESKVNAILAALRG
jgi:hypothetical protein